jgi:S1-C subfamily serine protease
LFNSFGEVIGINTAKSSGTGIEGLGFAIPISHAAPIIESLIQNGYVAGRRKSASQPVRSQRRWPNTMIWWKRIGRFRGTWQFG